MYGFYEHIEITPEQLLQKVTQEQIFEFILEEPFHASSRYVSPFRYDTKPGCRFETREDGSIVFVDFGERLINPSKTHRSCFGMVMDKYGLTLDGAIRLLCGHFGLSTDSSNYESITKAEYTKQPKVKAIMTYEPRPFNKSDIWLWSQFLIKPDHLKEDNVYSAKRFTIKTPSKYRIISPYKYCYVIDFIDAIKVYQPFNENYKWITNCNENHIGNIDNLPESGDELIIKKSYKDHRVLRNLDLGLNVIWLINEGAVPSIEILKNLVDRFKLITVFFDNDMMGTLAAMKLVDILNSIRENCARMVHLPLFIDKKEHWKDPGAFIKKEGRVDLIRVLKYIGIC